MQVHCIKSKILWIILFYTLLCIFLIGYYSLSNAYDINYKMHKLSEIELKMNMNTVNYHISS